MRELFIKFFNMKTFNVFKHIFKDMNTISINGKTIQVAGNNISVVNDSVFVDGIKIETGLSGTVKIEFTGDLAKLDCSQAVINGNVNGKVDSTHLNMTGNITGNVDSVHVTCGDIGGNVDATHVKAKEIKGKVDAVHVN